MQLGERGGVFASPVLFVLSAVLVLLVIAALVSLLDARTTGSCPDGSC